MPRPPQQKPNPRTQPVAGSAADSRLVGDSTAFETREAASASSLQQSASFSGDPATLLRTSVAPYEDPAELSSRLQREEFEHAFHVWSQIIVLSVAGLMVIGLFLVCLYLIANRVDSPIVVWAQTVVVSTITAVIGYIAGRNTT